MYRNYALALIGALCLLSCNKEKAPDPVKYHFALKDAETSAAVEVDADASGSYTWTVEAAAELTDLETSVSLDGTPVTEGVIVEKLEEGGLTVTLSYAANDSFVPKVWTVSVSTQNPNVDLQTLTMTLTQKALEDKAFSLSAASDEVDAAAGTKTFHVVADDDVNWTVSIEPSATVTIEGFEPNVLSASGTKDVTINYVENRGFDIVSYVVKVTTEATVANPTLTYILTQKASVAEFTDVAGLKSLITASETEFRGVLTDAVVTYVNGSSVFIEDASAGIMLYLYNSGFKAGQKLNGAVTASGYLFNNLPELVSLSAATVEDGADIPCNIVTLAELATAEGYDKWESRRVKVEGAIVEKSIVGGKNVAGMLSQGGSTFATYNQASVTIGSKGDVIDIISYPTAYKDTKQLYVFGNDFIVIKSTPGVITMAAAKTLKVGDEVSLGASVNSGAAVTYESSDSSVVAVKGNGLIVARAEGSVTITATAPANGIYTEASATCQVTVVPNVATEEILVNETFKTSQGAFTVNNIALAEKLADKGVWKHNADALGGVMVGNLYSRTNKEVSKTRLESPEFSLKDKSEYATLSFKHDGKFVKDDIYKVQYTTDGGETWNDATIEGDAFLPDKVNDENREWKLMDATVDLSAALGAEKVKFGFYLEGKDMTWEFNSVVLKAK